MMYNFPVVFLGNIIEPIFALCQRKKKMEYRILHPPVNQTV
jgi:hypothetical protein